MLKRNIPTLSEIMNEVDEKVLKSNLESYDRDLDTLDMIKNVNSQCVMLKDMINELMDRMDRLEQRMDKYEN